MGVSSTIIYNNCDASGQQAAPDSGNFWASNPITQVGYATKVGDVLSAFAPDITGSLPANAYVFSAVLTLRFTAWGDSAADSFMRMRLYIFNNTSTPGLDAFITWNGAQSGGIRQGPVFFQVGGLDWSYDADVTSWVQDLQNNRINRTWAVMADWTAGMPPNQYCFIVARENGAWQPIISTTYGFKLPGNPTLTTGINQVTANWPGAFGADNYTLSLRRQSDNVQVASRTSTVGNQVFTGLDPLVAYYIQVTANYSGYGSTGTFTSSSVTPLKYQPSIPSALGDTPYRRAIRVTAPTALPGNFGHERWDFRIMTDTGVQATSVTNIAVQSFDFTDYNVLPAGSYFAQVRPRWIDGRLGDWSSNSVSVSITTPTVTNVLPSNNLNKQLNVQWDRLPDAASYSISTVPSVLTALVPNPTSGSTVSYLFTIVRSGIYTVQVTPNYTNGYTGPVGTGTGSGVVVAPTPTFPTGVGDTPLKRQIRVTMPGGAVSTAFFSAEFYHIRRDNDDTTILSTNALTVDMSQVPAGTHSLQARAKWVDGDLSSWSASSPLITTTTPKPTLLLARQRSALNAVATTSVQAGGTLPTTNTYYIAVSTNKGGARSTETVITTRAVNESTPSLLQASPVTVTAGNQTIRVTRPTTCQVGDTWNVYLGRDRSVFKRVATSVVQGTATFDITSAPSFAGGSEAKAGGVDLSWVAPAGVADAPLTYRVERSPVTNQANASSPPGGYVLPSPGKSGLYSSNLKFWENDVGTGWHYYRVAAVWSNETSQFVEILV